jgi:hypothetical protein
MAEQQHGGARPRAGRKRKATKYESAIQTAETKIIDKLPDIIENLLTLADGGQQIITEEWQPAGLVTLTKHDEDKDKFYQVQAFPDLDPLETVLVKRTVVTAGRDRAANQYLVDRVMGKATQRLQILKPDKPFEEMTDAELAEYIASTTGPS